MAGKCPPPVSCSVCLVRSVSRVCQTQYREVAVVLAVRHGYLYLVLCIFSRHAYALCLRISPAALVYGVEVEFVVNFAVFSNGYVRLAVVAPVVFLVD